MLIFVAVAPLVGFGAAQLYSAEVAGPLVKWLSPRVQDTAKILVYVYGALSLGGVVALSLAGMGPFDAVEPRPASMLLGRLEIFTALALLSSAFWRR